MCAPVQMQRQQVKNNPGTFRRRDDINVIEVGIYILAQSTWCSLGPGGEFGTQPHASKAGDSHGWAAGMSVCEQM